MRDLINLIEASLNPKELAKHQGKYLGILLQYIDNNKPVAVSPEYQAKFGKSVLINPAMSKPLKQALKHPEDIKSYLPKNIILKNGQTAPWGVLYKGTEFTQLAGQKTYNAGHLAELFMGFSMSTKFLNAGNPITSAQVLTVIKASDAQPQGKNYLFKLSSPITYNKNIGKNDQLEFTGLAPGKSSESFIKQIKTNRLAPDLSAVLNSAVKYINESRSVKASCERVIQDKNTNKINVISDGTSDARGTKADLTLSIDGEKIDLLSLKTYSSKTLGQISGLKFPSLQKWFQVGFDIDISKYRKLLDAPLDEKTIYDNLLTEIYDKVVYPQVQKIVKNQKPNVEAKIVKHLTDAANFFARGEKLENVEVVKLDDKVSTGSYKVLRFSDNLYQAMQHLDLDTRLVSSANSRTIQIWTKPQEGEKIAKGSNLLCQFRTGLMGGYARNFFETGPMLELLTKVEHHEPIEIAPARDKRNKPTKLRQKR